MSVHRLAAKGTWRPFTRKELDKLDVHEDVLRGFMDSVMRSLINDPGFLPPQRTAEEIELYGGFDGSFGG